MNDDKLKELEELVNTNIEKFNESENGECYGLKAQKIVFDKWSELTIQVVPDLITAYRQLGKAIKEISKSKIEELFHDASVLAGNQNRAEAEEVQYCRLKKVVGFYLDLTSGDLDKIVEITNDYKKYSKNFNIKYGLAEDESIAYKNLSEANAELLAALKQIREKASTNKYAMEIHDIADQVYNKHKGE